MTKDGYISKLQCNSVGIGVSLLLPILFTSSLFLAAAKPVVTKAGSVRPVAGRATPAKPLAPAPAADGGRVTEVRFWSLGDVTRVAIEVSSSFTYTADRLSNPDRLFFDLRGASPEMVHKGTRSIPVGDPLVNQIRIAETLPKVTRVVLDLARPVSVTTSLLTNPNRLIVELRAKEGPLTRSGASEITVNRTPDASAVPTSAAPASSAPVSVDPSKPDVAKSRTRESAAKGRAVPKKPDVVSHPAAPPAIPVEPELLASAKLSSLAKPTLPPVVTELPTIAPPPPSLPGNEPSAARTSSLGDPSLTRVLGLKLGRIVLDAGHGGQDVGTHGPSGYLEKDLVLDVTHRLGALLEDRMGSEVIYTRSDDTFVPLEERTKIANQRKADLFLSIHANSSPVRSVTGVETYVLNFTPSRGANELAARENASSSSSIHDLRNLVEKIAAVDKANESRELAARLQTSLSAISKRAGDPNTNRGVKRAPFVVLIGAVMPSVLAEIGFLTNGEEEGLLRKPEHRQKIAEALFKGIASYAETLSRFDVARKAD